MLYNLTAFTGSFLLFLIQPMLARMVLPALGGSAQVWNTCILFFQFSLLAGYAYAHWLGTKLNHRFQLPLHVTLGILASFLLPLSLAETSSPPVMGSPIIWLLKLLATQVGPPFFILLEFIKEKKKYVEKAYRI